MMYLYMYNYAQIGTRTGKNKKKYPLFPNSLNFARWRGYL